MWIKKLVKLKNYLEKRGFKYYCSDPYSKGDGIIKTNSLIQKSDIIVVATPHLEYKKLKLPKNNEQDLLNKF